MNYGPGDEVVCIDATAVSGGLRPRGLAVGLVYVVGWTNGTCTTIPGHGPQDSGHCQACGWTDKGGWHYRAWRFIKLDKLGVDQFNEETAEV